MSIDMGRLRDYITAADDQQYATLPENVVSCDVSHSDLSQKWLELKFDKHETIFAIKTRLNKHCGTAVGMMELQLKSGGSLVAVMDDDKMFGFYSPAHGMEIHIVDHDVHSLSKGGALEDVSLVKKFELTEDQYDKMENTVRAYKRNKLKEDPTYKFKPLPGASRAPPKDVESKECIEGKEVGSRCSVKPGDRRGVVAFVGKVPALKPGYWVGVRFDEPVGKGNGTVGDKRFFECDQNYGAFARPHNVICGDFPPEDLLGSDFDSSDEEDESKTATAEGCGPGSSCCAPAAATAAAEAEKPTSAAAAAIKLAAEGDSDDEL